MRQILKLLSMVVLLLVCCPVHGQTVRVDYDKMASFSGLTTYAWGKGTPVANQLMDQRIVAGIDQQLAAKGMRKVDASANPDMIVLYHGAVSTQTQLDTTGMGWGMRWGGGMSTTTVQNIPVGKLIVDIGDAKTKKILWMGTATNTLSNNPDKNVSTLNKALEKMFKNFPPTPKQ
jgi:hypothetical protein